MAEHRIRSMSSVESGGVGLQVEVPVWARRAQNKARGKDRSLEPKTLMKKGNVGNN